MIRNSIFPPYSPDYQAGFSLLAEDKVGHSKIKKDLKTMSLGTVRAQVDRVGSI